MRFISHLKKFLEIDICIYYIVYINIYTKRANGESTLGDIGLYD